MAWVAPAPLGDLSDVQTRQTGPVRVSARVDYGIRALAQIAALGGDGPVKADRIAEAQDIPVRFLLDILGDLRSQHVVRSQRGADGGYTLARPANEIALADVFRALEGPIATVHDLSLSDAEYPGAASALVDVWKAMRVSLRDVFERVTIADLADGRLPDHVRRLAAVYDATTNLAAPPAG